uniref:Post-GPI attachment to proteins factor 2-like n=1 Tax=Caenorhabditis tropicalis TaxID=1561998 RepID=A0A1I7URI4_9PELO
MLSFYLAFSLLCSSGFLLPSFSNQDNVEEANTCFFWHLVTLWVFSGICLCLHAYLDFFHPDSNEISEKAYRRNCGIGLAALIVCVSLQQASFWLIHSDFWLGYCIFLSTHFLSFVILRGLVYPGMEEYGIQYNRILEYLFFGIILTACSTEIMARIQVYQGIWTIHAFYNGCITILLVDLHALLANSLTVYTDRVGDHV